MAITTQEWLANNPNYTPYGNMSKGQFGSSAGPNTPKGIVTQKYGGIDTTKLGGAVEANILDRLAGNKSAQLASTTTGAFNALARAGRDIQGQATASAYQSGQFNQGAGVSAQQQANRDILGAISQTHIGLADIAAKENAEAVGQGSKLLELKSSEGVAMNQLSEQQAQADKNRKLEYLKFLVDTGVAPEIFDEANSDTFKDTFGFELPEETKQQLKSGQEKSLAVQKAKDWVDSTPIATITDNIIYDERGNGPPKYRDSDGSERDFTIEEKNALRAKGYDIDKLASQKSWFNLRINQKDSPTFGPKLYEALDNPSVVKQLTKAGVLTVSPDLASLMPIAKSNKTDVTTTSRDIGRLFYGGTVTQHHTTSTSKGLQWHLDQSTGALYYSNAGVLYDMNGNKVADPIVKGE